MAEDVGGCGAWRVSEKADRLDNRQFAIDPKEPLHMYWGTCGMIWASQDGGEHWQPVFGKAPAVGDDQTPAIGHAIAVSASGAVYALDHDSVLRVSQDHGATWAELAKPPVAKNSRDTPAFPFFLADGTLCVSCRPSPGLAVSRDDGKTWELKLADSIILTARATPTGSGLFALDSTGKLHRTSDGGASFTMIKEVPHKWEPGLRFAGGLAVAGRQGHALGPEPARREQ